MADASTGRQCRTCGLSKTPEEFSTRKASGGRRVPLTQCRSCVREYNRRYRAANRDRLDRQRREWYEANRGHRSAYRRAWYVANRESVIEKQRRYAAENQDKIKAHRRATRDHRKAIRRAWHEANKEHVRAYVERNRERRREYYRIRRARLHNATITEFTADQLAQRMSMFPGCWMCGDPDWSNIDHVKPVAAGGAHCLSNLRPACAPCNRRKSGTWPWPTAVHR